MTALRLDARPLVSAAKAAIAAAAGPDYADSVYDDDEVPGGTGTDDATREQPLPDIFWIVSLERRANPSLRASTRTGRIGWRLSVRCLGRTTDEARWAMLRASVALNEQRLTDGTADDAAWTTRLQFESDEAPEPDDGRHAGRSTWTFFT